MEHVLVTARVTSTLGICRLPVGMAFSEQLVVFAFSSYAWFAALQARAHEVWARFAGSSLKDDLRYTPTDCFMTFPFALVMPVRAGDSLETNGHVLEALEASGREHYEFRAALMVRNNEGLTKTYNRFHDPDERSPDILKLRELHAAMDRAVLDAYGWHDLAEKATCEFLLDYVDDEDDEPEAPASGRRSRKKPWRYRWPDDLRDEVLARLLDLNQKRAEEERLSGLAAEAKSKRSGRNTKRSPHS
jgi:hypothetical protein